MKTVRFAKFLSIAPLFLLIFAFSQTANAQRSNVIEGQIFDEYRNPVNNAYVELYDNLDRLVANTRSSSQGRYTFRNVSTGRFTVKVKPYGTNLKETSDVVEVYSPTGMPDYVQLNFRLEEDKSMRPQTPLVNETVYAQEVPQDAERAYKKGVEKLKANNKDGFKDLENALKIFPTYFYALRDMGVYTVSDGRYEEGYPYLLKAVDVHRRCGECFYHLANAFSNMKQNDAAVKAGEAAVALLPNNSYAYLMYGVVLRLDEQYKPAESALQKANTLFDKPNPSVYWELSLVHNRLGENAKAADDLTAYLDANPDLKKEEKKSVEDLIKKLRSGKAD